MTCCFFGHRSITCNLRPRLKEVILALIREGNVNVFYIGNNGDFDCLAQSVLAEIIAIMKNVKYYIFSKNRKFLLQIKRLFGIIL